MLLDRVAHEHGEHLVGLDGVARVFDFGLRTSRDEAEQSRIVAGLRGNLGSHDYEVGLFTNESKLSGTVPDGYFSQVAYAKAIQASNEWNPWSLTLTDNFRKAIEPATMKAPPISSETLWDPAVVLMTGWVPCHHSTALFTARQQKVTVVSRATTPVNRAAGRVRASGWVHISRARAPDITAMPPDTLTAPSTLKPGARAPGTTPSAPTTITQRLSHG